MAEVEAKAEGVFNMADTVVAVDMADAKEPKTAKTVFAPTAHLTAIQQMHTEDPHMVRREEGIDTSRSCFPVLSVSSFHH